MRVGIENFSEFWYKKTSGDAFSVVIGIHWVIYTMWVMESERGKIEILRG